MNIKQLINKFYEGISTQEEELLLMEYFLNEKKIDERWKEEQRLFRLLHDTNIQVPAEVSKRLEESIINMDESPEKLIENPLIISLETSGKSTSRQQKWYYWISSAAAVALLCIGLFFTMNKPSHPKLADTYSNPEEAALVAQQTLAFMSMQLNKGLDMAADAGQEFEKVNQLLNKHLNK